MMKVDTLEQKLITALPSRCWLYNQWQADAFLKLQPQSCFSHKLLIWEKQKGGIPFILWTLQLNRLIQTATPLSCLPHSQEMVDKNIKGHFKWTVPYKITEHLPSLISLFLSPPSFVQHVELCHWQVPDSGSPRIALGSGILVGWMLEHLKRDAKYVSSNNKVVAYLN